MNEYMCQERFPAQEIIVPVGGYCYILDVGWGGGGGVPTKNVCEETSAVAGAEPKSQLEPRHHGGRRGGGGGKLWLWWDH